MGHETGTASDDTISTIFPVARHPIQGHDDRLFLMKLDIQGFESRAFRGASQLLRRRAVDVFVIEFDPRLQAHQGGSCEEIVMRLHAAGYVFFEGAMISHNNNFETLRVSLGQTRTVIQYIDLLRKHTAYTDLVAVKYELVPRVLVNGALQAVAALARPGKRGGRGGHGGRGTWT